MKSFSIGSLVVLFTVFAFSIPALAQNLSADEVMAKHLESVGTKEKRHSVTTLFAAGFSEFESKVPEVKGGGKAVVVSDPNNLFFVLSFNSRDYPFEKIGAFGKKISLPFISAGNRSLLGSFLTEHSKVLSDNLFCGSMSLRWINHIALNRMKSAGKKNLMGRQTYAIDVMPSGSGSDEFKVRIYLDAETFRHVRSEYHREGRVGRVMFGEQNQQAAAKVELIEDFTDFKDVEGLTLPHTYKITFLSNSTSRMYQNSWGVRVANYYINQKLASDFFTFDIKD
jgi:hypothetical protein